MQEFRAGLEALSAQLAEARQESASLRRELQDMRDRLSQDQELLAAKVDDQEQTKIESGSKYHVRLSGLALLNVVSTRGGTDNLDVPLVATPRLPGDTGGAISAGVRQSFVGLDVFGPAIRGAKTSGALALDFFGGFPEAPDGLTEPLVRLRTATIKIDWPSFSIVAGQEAPFFSAGSPTSLASTAYPSLASAGNLWTWTPQVYAERRFAVSQGSTLALRGGLLDPLTGEEPASEYSRLPTAGERSRVPALATHVGWQAPLAGSQAQLGAGAYYSRQAWGFDRTVTAWAATADWNLPAGRWLELSGELYRGQSLAGLGGGASAGVLLDGDATNPASAAIPVETMGGWLQWKARPSTRLQVNSALGQDNPSCAAGARRLSATAPDGLVVCRNRSAFVNTIFQARSNLLFAVEYRRLWTAEFSGARSFADHLSVSMGIGY